jgi:hypothetical protein
MENLELLFAPVGIVPDGDSRYKRVFAFDSTQLIPRVRGYIEANGGMNERHSSIPVGVLFPHEQKTKCACGCGRYLLGRRRKYATDECAQFVTYAFMIVAGYTDVICAMLSMLHGYKCSIDGCCEKDSLQVDHIVAVVNGGSLAWLSNYRLICPEHHKLKTKQDIQKSKVLKIKI